MPILEACYDYFPGRGLRAARANRDIAHKVAEQLLESKSKDVLMGKENRDILSILGKCEPIVIAALGLTVQKIDP